jgi:1-acyl-sn-glycerol-3-phosphate acyltransferase
MPRKARFVAWDALWKVPALGWFLSRFSAIPGNQNQASLYWGKETRKALKAGELVGIFPEGGRSPGPGEVGPFQSGAARLSPDGSTPLIPVAIHCHKRVWPVGRPYPLPGPYRIQIGDPVTPGTRKPDDLLQELRLWIVDRLREGFPLDRRR